MRNIRVLVADDHRLVREGIESMLVGAPEIQVVGLAASGEEAINIARSAKPDVVLMDIIMPGMNGLEAARWVKELSDNVRVIILTMEISKDYVTAAIKSDVDGYLPKNVGKGDLLTAIRSVHGGEQHFDEAVKKLIFEDFYDAEISRKPKKGLPNELTKREAQVLALVATGRSNHEISEQLGVSVKTIETHKTHILMKLGLNNNAELTRYAVKHKIIAL